MYPGSKNRSVGIPGLFCALFFLVLSLVSCRSPEKSYYDNGQLKFVLSKNSWGKLDGESKFWYENGNLQLKADYKNGKLNGTLARYREDGSMETEDSYSDGKLNGTCREFFQNGRVKSENTYLNDTLHGPSRQFDMEGHLFEEGNYDHGLYEGQWIYYDRFGNIIGEGQFTRGTGVRKAYDANGNVVTTIEYKDNLMHGKAAWYSIDGKQIRSVYYDHGEMMDRPVTTTDQ